MHLLQKYFEFPSLPLGALCSEVEIFLQLHIKHITNIEKGSTTFK